jgi:hypothetical protein
MPRESAHYDLTPAEKRDLIDFVFADQNGIGQHQPTTFAASFTEYKA